MSLFVERAPTMDAAQAIAQTLLRANPADADNIDKVTNAAKTIQATATGGTTKVNWMAILVGFVAGAILIGAGVYLIWLGDQQAIEQAKLAAANTAYTPPTLGIAAAGTSLITLGGAWSAALVTVLLTGK